MIRQIDWLNQQQINLRVHTNGHSFNSKLLDSRLNFSHDLEESLFRTQLIAFHSPQTQLIAHCFADVTLLVSQIDNWLFSIFQVDPLLCSLAQVADGGDSFVWT